MAGPTQIAWADPRVIKLYSPQMFAYALANNRLIHLVGTDPHCAILKNEDLTRKPGGDVVFKIKKPLSGTGQGDYGNTVNNEQQMEWGNMSVRVHQRMTAILSGGILAEQLTDVYGVAAWRKEMMDSCAEWNAEIQENDLITTAAGLYNENSGGASIETINESAPTTNRIWRGGQEIDSTPILGNSGVSYASDALLTAGTQTANLFGTLVGRKLKSLAIQATPRIRPCWFRQDSQDKADDVRFDVKRPPVRVYVCLVHPAAMESMKAELGTNGFADLMKMCHAQAPDHPLFTGGNAYLDGVLYVEYDRIPKRTGAGGTTLAEGFTLNDDRDATTDAAANGRKIVRNIFLGAQALCWGWAKRPIYAEDKLDVTNLKVKTECL